MPITKEQFLKIKSENPGVEIAVLEHDRLPDQVIARAPSRGMWSIYLQMQADGRKVEAAEHLVAGCVLFPDKDELQRSLDAHPALAQVWAGELNEMAGVTMGARQKKYDVAS